MFLKYSDQLPNVEEVAITWIENLPFKKFNTEKSKKQYLGLTDFILNKNTGLIFGNDGQRLQKVIEIFADIADGKSWDDQIKEKVQSILKLLMASPATAAVLKEIGEKLTDERKLKLNALLSV